MTGSDTAAALVIGTGNPLRRDDGAGPAVVERLQGARLPPAVELMQHNGDGLSLINTWQSYAYVILIDAACAGGNPGTIHRFEASAIELPRDLLCSSSHLFGPAEAIALARSLGRLPDKLLVYGIEGIDFAYGEGLSPEVAQAVGMVTERIMAEIRAARPGV